MSVRGAADRPEALGDKFERTLGELIRRLLEDDLGLTVTDVVHQPRGAQGGKDVQVRWVNPDGKERFWHFECKNWNASRGVLPEKEIGDKILQEARSPHGIDVWCLALSENEPSKDIDDLINAAPANPGLDYAIAVLSPQRGGIRWLYACHRHLYEEQYGAPPPGMTAKERKRHIERFAQWIELRSEERPDRRPMGWEVISKARLDRAEDDPALARSYLSGSSITCPWPAVVHGWTVARANTEAKLLAFVEGAEPGFAYEWLISAGGEGKSTVLKRLAARVAREQPRVQVLWADDSQDAEIPLAWLGEAESGSSFLFCVDGSAHLTGLGSGIGAMEKLAKRNISVRVVLSDRGNRWKANRARLLRPRAYKPPLKLEPLKASEQQGLLDLMGQRGLLRAASRSEAAKRLEDAAAGMGRDTDRGRWTPWLVPAVMELADPRGRPFAQILTSILEELRDSGEQPSLRLLLATAVLDSAGPGLPKDIAGRLLGSEPELTQAADILDCELERQFAQPSSFSIHPAERFRTHGSAVSEGLVRVASGNRSLRPWLVEIAGALPALMRPEYDPHSLLRKDRFDLLDTATAFLDSEVGDDDAVLALLTSWTELDPTGFFTWSRLGNAYSHSIRRGISDPEADRAKLLAEVLSARLCFERSLEISDRVLNRASVPSPYAEHRLHDVQRVVYHSWATLEATIGTRHRILLGSHDDLVRATYLSMLSLGPEPNLVHCCGLLARVLTTLGELQLCAPIVACLSRVDGGRHPVIGRLEPKLKAAGVEVPEGGVDLLPQALLEVIAKVLQNKWHLIPLAGDEDAHRRLLHHSVTTALTELDVNVDPGAFDSLLDEEASTAPAGG